MFTERQKPVITILILILSICFLLSGCLICEQGYLFIDLNKKTGEIRYENIGSDSTEEKNINEDFQDLIENYYLGNDIQEGHPSIKIISKKLYEEKGQLNGKVTFSFTNLKDALNDFEIEIDKDGSYVTALDSSTKYIEGNGEYIEEESGNKMKWNNDVETIESRFQLVDLEAQEMTSLLSRWQEWEKDNLDTTE